MNQVTYLFYTGNYKGDIIPSSSFDKMILRAETYLNYVGEYTPESDDVKMCKCAIADELYKAGENGQLKSSESLGSWSVSYITSSQTLSNRLSDVIDMYLHKVGGNVHWL